MILAATIAAAGPTLVAAPVSAASTDAVFMIGHGTFSPGLPALPISTTFNISGWANVTGTHRGTYTCGILGSAILENWIEGFGFFYGGCGPITLNGCIYVRVGVDMTVSCEELIVGPVIRSVHGHFIFIPDQLPPATITSFLLQGGMLYVDT